MSSRMPPSERERERLCVVRAHRESSDYSWPEEQLFRSQQQKVIHRCRQIKWRECLRKVHRPNEFQVENDIIEFGMFARKAALDLKPG
jgi:hypothetical protein